MANVNALNRAFFISFPLRRGSTRPTSSVPDIRKSPLVRREFADARPNSPSKGLPASAQPREMLNTEPFSMAKSARRPQSSRPAAARVAQSQPAQLVDPRWILKALFTVIVVALILTYGTLCLLFSQGQWQLVLHPSRTVAATPASAGLAFSEVHFFPGPSGEPQLDGWLIPATSAAPTALMLHGGDGSMADALPDALTLHKAGLNVLLFDYRGFGRSAGRHPDESSMQDDSDAALQFLAATQHTALPSIVVYGSGLGASLAVRLATNHHEIPAIILDSPDGDFEERARKDPRARLVPTRWLFNQTFPLAAPLQQLTTPKLLITFNTQHSPAVQHAADPKITVELPGRDGAALVSAIQRFVDQYVFRR